MPAERAKSSGGKIEREFSAGGIVRDSKGRLLMVKVKNLNGETVWTFPKGHIERGETAEASAVREVEEETGWKCEISGELPEARYWFRRGPLLVHKKVRWFEMKPLRKTGAPAPDEILEVEWVSGAEARRRAKYKSDLALLNQVC